MRRQERCLKEMQQYHQITQNVFSNWLVHINCLIMLINRRLQSQSLSLTELCFLFLLKINQFMKNTATEEKPITLCSLRRSVTGEIVKYLGTLEAVQWFQKQIHIPK